MSRHRRPDDPHVRFRIYVDGQLVDEAWADVSNPAVWLHVTAISVRHRTIAERAQLHDRPWLMEVYDPEQPEDRAYRRTGTDAAGMVDPRPL